MKRALLILSVCLAGMPGPARAEKSSWRLGEGGHSWADWTGLNVMVDDAAVPGAIQPLELRPDQNAVAQLRDWTRYYRPIDLHYRGGMPRIWRGTGAESRPGHEANEIEFIDGNLGTFYADRQWNGAEFFSLDMGARVPAERFVVVPPAGVDPFFQEPYTPNYYFERYELSATNSQALVDIQVAAAGPYQPFDVLLSKGDQNLGSTIDLRFPLQYLRFFRVRLVHGRFALAELEVYGRGFVPRARWESKVIDLGRIANIGQVIFGAGNWRKTGERLAPAPEAAAGVRVEIKTGLDETPVAYHSYGDLGQPVEVKESEYEGMKPRVWPWDPPAVGWQGPIVEDQKNWSFWSSPLRQSGQSPRVPRGRYALVRVELESGDLWEFARMDSLVVETSPLLAERVTGELAAAHDLQPADQLLQVPAGAMTQFVCELRAEFSGADQEGFDAVRVLLPAAGKFQRLAMGEPPAAAAPDSVVEGAREFAVYLPRRVARDEHLRLWLETAVYGASGELGVEVFERSGTNLPQGVEPGDASAEIGTDRLQVVVAASSLGSILDAVGASPRVFTPQGDGVNDRLQISYTLFRVLEQIQVEVGIYTLEGQRVRRLPQETQGAGRQQVEWDGLDDRGNRVAPGIYLVRVEAEADEGRRGQVQSIAVAY